MGIVIRDPILLSAKQDVSNGRTIRPRQESAARRAEIQADPALCTFPHQRRRSTGIGKTDDILQRVQRITSQDIAFPFCDNVLAVQSKIYIFRCHIERIQQMFHGFSFMASAR